MEQNSKTNIQNSKEQYETLAFVFGVISLVGLFCCFPVMFIVGALGAIFASISRGESRIYSGRAKTGLIFSVIGIVASMVMTVGIVTYSFYDIAKQVRDNPGYVDELHDLFNNTLDMQQIPEAEEMKEYYNQYFEQLEDWAGQLQKNP